MKATKFVESYRCDCYEPQNSCNCPGRTTTAVLFNEQINYVAKSILKVMSICGILRINSSTALNIIIYHFLHYNEYRYRVDAIPRKRINRSAFLHDFAKRCNMDRIQTQIAYSICKRAFKAFYYGTGDGGVPNPKLRAQLKHTPQCLWHYAAYRTAQVYGSLMDLFPICQKALEIRIRGVYQILYSRLKTKQQCFEDHECVCKDCVKSVLSTRLPPVPSALLLLQDLDPFEEIYQKEVAEIEESAEYKQMLLLQLPCQSIEHCNCPRLKFHKGDTETLLEAEITNTGYSQGPFECFWYAINKEDDIDENQIPEMNIMSEYPCPPCGLEEDSCDDACECDCETCVCESDVEEPVSEETEDSKEQSEQEEIEEFELGPRAVSVKYNRCRVPTIIYPKNPKAIKQQSSTSLRSSRTTRTLSQSSLKSKQPTGINSSLKQKVKIDSATKITSSNSSDDHSACT